MSQSVVPLTLAHSPCPNDTFVFHALTHGLVRQAPPIEVTYADVDVTNTSAQQGRYDLVKVSFAAVPYLLDRYALLPCGGALGRGCGPLLLVKPADGIEDPASTGGLAGRHVAVPGERTTAYLLMRLWAGAQQPDRISIVPFNEIMPGVAAGQFDAGLVIHEARFTYRRYGLHSLVDLGQWWESATGLPIPLGAIMARRDTVNPIRAAEWIRSSVEHAMANPLASREYVLSLAQEMEPDVVSQHIALYVNGFTLDLGDEGYAAVEVLLTKAAQAGLTPAVPGLR